MTEPTEPRPELCPACERGWTCQHASHFFDCRDQRELWDSGYTAGKAASREECTLLAASLKQADKRAEAAADAYREADARCERLELDYTAEMSAREAEKKLAELVRDVREWRAERFGPGILDAILAKYDKPEGG